MASNDKKHLLLTNDDGLDAFGIEILEHELRQYFDLTVVAPDAQRSAVSHAITIHQPLLARQFGRQRFAVSGTPADCVMLGIFELCDRPPDLVISGINHGPNMGSNIHYSGTVAGAREAAMRKLPAIAVSQCVDRDEQNTNFGNFNRAHFSHTALFVRQFAQALFATTDALSKPVLDCFPSLESNLININAPAFISQSYAFTKVGAQHYQTSIEKRTNLRGLTYFWIGGEEHRESIEADDDTTAVNNGYFSVSQVPFTLSPPTKTVTMVNGRKANQSNDRALHNLQLSQFSHVS